MPRDSRRLTTWIVIAALALGIASLTIVYRGSRHALDEKGRHGLLSDGATHRWLREGLLIGKTEPQLREIFGADNVLADPKRPGVIFVNFDSNSLASIECTMKQSAVASAELRLP